MFSQLFSDNKFKKEMEKLLVTSTNAVFGISLLTISLLKRIFGVTTMSQARGGPPVT